MATIKKLVPFDYDQAVAKGNVKLMDGRRVTIITYDNPGLEPILGHYSTTGEHSIFVHVGRWTKEGKSFDSVANDQPDLMLEVDDIDFFPGKYRSKEKKGPLEDPYVYQLHEKIGRLEGEISGYKAWDKARRDVIEYLMKYHGLEDKLQWAHLVIKLLEEKRQPVDITPIDYGTLYKSAHERAAIAEARVKKLEHELKGRQDERDQLLTRIGGLNGFAERVKSGLL